MQIRCCHCTKTLALGTDGALPDACPHCAARPGPGALGPYQPLRLLASGGMGEVYLARHRDLGTEVALKLLPALPPEQLPLVRERFAREARLNARVRHPGVVQVLHSDVTGDRPYLVLELVRGQTLRQRLQQGPLPVDEAIRITAATAEVLAAAHTEGVFHRDVKPDNVMLEPDGAVRVLDFGIARAVQDDAPITRTGEILGTPEYMAPEQLLDGPEAIGAHTDVHALAVLGYELLTGRSPFRGANVFQTLKLVESLLPPAPSSLRTGIPPAVDRALLQALHKQPHDRPASAAAFAAALRAGLPTLAPAAPRQPWWFWLPLLCALLLLFALGWALQHRPAPAPPAPVANVDAADRAANAARQLAAARQDFATGSWCDALVQCERASRSPASQRLAQQAFVHHQLAWLLAAELPPWLARCDERRRRQLFGDELEPGPAADADTAAMQRLLALDASGPVTDHPQLRLLQLALRDDPALASALDAENATEPLVQLLRLRQHEPAARADGFAACAERLPIDGAEHWFARTIERHLRNDRRGGTEAAELAWLHGGGELAVLLDAALQLLPPQRAEPPADDAPPPPRPLLRRLAGTAPDDAPAAALLFALASCRLDAPPELGLCRALPTAARPFASRWFVAHAAGRPTERTALLLVAASLGAVPDYQQAPWRDLPSEQRATIDAESSRGR